MSFEVGPGLVMLFGSAQRARTLAVLANARGPVTGYRVAKATGDKRSKVYAEIHRLARGKIITGSPTERGAPGWVLSDPDLRRLLRRSVRLTLSEDCAAWLSERNQRTGTILEALRTAAHAAPPRGWRPREPARFRRSSKKDELLRKMRLPGSIHAEPA